MGEIFIEYAWEIFFGIISAILLGYIKTLHARNKELEKMQQADTTRQHKQMILDEIEPLIEEIARVRKEDEQKIMKAESHFLDTIALNKKSNDSIHEGIVHDVDAINKKIESITNSYKFRLIQLCRIHLRNHYITQADFDQITELYKLYHEELGGNGQAQEYYEKVLQLEIVENNYKPNK